MESANPDYRIRYVIPAESANAANRFLLLPRKGPVHNPLLSSTDTATGQLLSTAPVKNGWLFWMHDLHSNLLLGPNGRTLNGVVALALMCLCLSGLVIWFPKQQWRLSFRTRWKRQVWNLHNAAGIFTVAFLALQGFIGAYFAFPNVYRAALGLGPRVAADADDAGDASPNSAMKKKRRKSADSPAAASPGLPLDSFVKKAHAMWPEFQIATLYPPRANQLITIRGRMPGDPLGRHDASRLIFDARSGNLVRAIDAGRLPFAEQAIFQMQAIHFGRFQDSLISHVVWVLLGLMPGALYITGLVMWLNRMKAKWRTRQAMQRRLRAKPEPAMAAALN